MLCIVLFKSAKQQIAYTLRIEKLNKKSDKMMVTVLIISTWN